MGYKIKTNEFNNILQALSKNFRVYAPVKMEGKGPHAGTDMVAYGEISKIEAIVFDQKSIYSAKDVVFKPVETLFYFTDEEFKQPDVKNDNLLIFARPCDINAFKRLDEIFINNGPYPDNYYQQQRDKVKFILMECGEGFENCFCVSMGTNATDDFALAIKTGDGFVDCLVKDPDLAPYFNGFTETRDLPHNFVKQNKVQLTLPQNLGPTTFKNPLWEEYTARCTGCGRCNFVCPTCSCFTLQDIFYRDNNSCGERRRVWASCMVDGFTDMAGGHGFRDKQGERMRFKVMHKFYDFEKSFGYHMCVGCGRCDDICPEYISIITCVEKLNPLGQGVNGNDD